MASYFTSDLHIKHRLVAGHRGFWLPGNTLPMVPDTDAHDQAVIEAFKVVGPDDIVWIIGDLCVYEKYWAGVLRFIADYLPGRKRLINGNHDRSSAIHREFWKHQREALDVFESVSDFARIRMSGGDVLLSHYPYSGTGAEGLRKEDGSELEERYAQFRLKDHGTPLIHGHTHGKEKLHFSDEGTPQVHVGLDAWDMQLVPQHEVEKLFDTIPPM